mmetsp:Transcript_33321/g.75435  ORF Transcript_33321/g.75435 Transcript_33321/m.75435 type:complete len:213 (-) Transcript_33321:131-769(-)
MWTSCARSYTRPPPRASRKPIARLAMSPSSCRQCASVAPRLTRLPPPPCRRYEKAEARVMSSPRRRCRRFGKSADEARPMPRRHCLRSGEAGAMSWQPFRASEASSQHRMAGPPRCWHSWRTSRSSRCAWACTTPRPCPNCGVCLTLAPLSWCRHRRLRPHRKPRRRCGQRQHQRQRQCQPVGRRSERVSFCGVAPLGPLDGVLAAALVKSV